MVLTSEKQVVGQVSTGSQPGPAGEVSDNGTAGATVGLNHIEQRSACDILLAPTADRGGDAREQVRRPVSRTAVITLTTRQHSYHFSSRIRPPSSLYVYYRTVFWHPPSPWQLRLLCRIQHCLAARRGSGSTSPPQCSLRGPDGDRRLGPHAHVDANADAMPSTVPSPITDELTSAAIAARVEIAARRPTDGYFVQPGMRPTVLLAPLFRIFKGSILMVSNSSFLGVLSPADMNRVLQHPAQQANISVVAALTQMRACRTPVAYDEFQRRLFQVLHSREEHKGQCRHCAHRLQRGKQLPDPLPQLPRGTDPDDPRRGGSKTWSSTGYAASSVPSAMAWHGAHQATTAGTSSRSAAMPHPARWRKVRAP